MAVLGANRREALKRSLSLSAKITIVTIIVLCGFVVFWKWLPSIAAYGMRFPIAEKASMWVLVQCGPRGVGVLLSRQTYEIPGVDYAKLVVNLCKLAEKDDGLRGKILKSFSEADVKGLAGTTLLNWSAENDCLKMVEDLLKAGADPNSTIANGIYPLHFAAWRGNPEMVRLLVKYGAIVNQEASRVGGTPLNVAASCGEVWLARVTHSRETEYLGRCAEVVKALVSAGADMNMQPSSDAFTPLHWAVQTNNKPCVEALLELGADPNKISTRPLAQSSTYVGRTPLDIAIASDSSEIADLLRQRGAKTATEAE